MRRVWDGIRAFLSAEEVPRWFGLSIVLIYLMGLAAVACGGMHSVRREAAAQLEQRERGATALLTQHLAEMVADAGSDYQLRWGQALRRFADTTHAQEVRVKDAGQRIVASSLPGEVGQTMLVDHSVESGGRRPVRMALRVGPEQPLVLEASFPDPLSGMIAPASSADVAIAVLVGLGALFVVYRCLRTNMRASSQITERLRFHQDHLLENLESLRLNAESDGLASAWNQLIELTHTLSESARRSTASEELSRALSKTGGGALAEALNAIPDGIICITDEVRLEYLNASACQMLGWSAADAKKFNLAEAHSTALGAQVLAAIRKSLQPTGLYEAKTELLEGHTEEGGDPSTYRLWITPLQRANRTGECIVVVRDVSQQVRAERAREDFVTQVTHELRTPLTNIRAYAETLSSGMFDDAKVIGECYNVITKETRRLSRLIEDILSVSQLEVGSIELRLDSVDLKILLTEGVRDVRQLADDKNIDLQLVLPPKRELIQADKDKLAVVINNLLGNAIKYTPKGGNVIVGCQFSPDTALISVKDNGIGIDPADHSRVFEKFQRANDPAVQAETGTGIGLYTAREMVRRHGGDIELLSVKGQGSTFMVRLPHQESRAAALSAGEGA